MSVLRIEEDDLLWKYYKKAYTTDRMLVEHPQNLCKYFWTAVWGCIMSFYTERSLWIVWGVQALVVALFGTFCYLGGATSFGFVGPLVAILATFILLISSALTMSSTSKRLYGKRLERFEIACGITMLLAILSFLTWVGYSVCKTPWQDSLVVAGVCFGALAMVILLSAVIISIGWGLIFLLRPVASWKVWAYMGSRKRNVCPLIEPPESFLAEYECRKSKE